jgi:hypothetical protein
VVERLTAAGCFNWWHVGGGGTHATPQQVKLLIHATCVVVHLDLPGVIHGCHTTCMAEADYLVVGRTIRLQPRPRHLLSLKQAEDGLGAYTAKGEGGKTAPCKAGFGQPQAGLASLQHVPGCTWLWAGWFSAGNPCCTRPVAP